MNARFAHVLSRLSIVSVVAVSALGAAACARGPAGPEATPTVETTQAAQSTETASQPTSQQHTPGRWFFRQVEALDLRADQRSALSEIEQNLQADLAPHRETMRQITHALADALEQGQLDPATAAGHKATLLAALADVKASFSGAINGVHDTLDATQRAALVQSLQQQHERHAQSPDQAEHRHGLAKLAFELGLSEAQKQSLHDAIQQGVDEALPDRKARREAWEAKMKAMSEAFVSDSFDAADFDLAEHAEETLATFVTITSRAVDISNQVLSDGQRQAAAELMRNHADKL